MDPILHYVAQSGSRELFRLAVLALAFGVPFALGAFFGDGRVDRPRRSLIFKSIRELVAAIPSDHQTRLRHRRANTSPHDSPLLRILSGSLLGPKGGNGGTNRGKQSDRRSIDAQRR
jgi:hypothetical protein